MEDPGSLFVDRTEELELIEQLLTALREGAPANLCFSGIPGSGKTTLFHQYLAARARSWGEEGVILVHLPLAELGETASEIALRLVPRVAAAFLAAVGMDEEARRLVAEDTFPDEARRLQSRALEAFAEEADRFMHTEGSEDEEIFRAALAFPAAFAAEKDLRFVLFMDDFHVLQRLRVARGRTAADLFQQTFAGPGDVVFVVATVPSPFTDRVFLSEQAPFHQAFQFYSLPALPPPVAEDLAREILGSGGAAATRAARLATGVPLYLTAIARAAVKGAGNEATPEVVDRAFAAEALVPWGSLYRHFDTLVGKSLARSSDQETARTLLAALAEGKRMSKEDLARECGLDPKAAASMLGRIVSVGLFRRVENTYYFDDPLFRFWALRAAGRKGQSQERITGPESTARAEEFLAQSLPGPREAAGGSKKFNFRALVAAMKGRDVEGRLLGRDGPVPVPEFERVQGFAFSSKEIKVYYLAAPDQAWVLLVLWRKAPVDEALLEIFARRTLGRAHGLWFVGKGGFTESALAFGKQHGIFCSSEEDLKALMEVGSA